MFGAFFGWLAGKGLGMLGDTVLKPILTHLQSKDVQVTKRYGAFLRTLIHVGNAEVKAREVASNERIALWESWYFRFLFSLVIVPPATYYALFWADTIFQFPWDLGRAPDRLEQMGGTIILTWIGAGTMASGLLAAVTKFIRK
jgi:hypothetical protein